MIIKLNGKDIEGVRDLALVAASQKPGSTATLTTSCDGRRQ
ncbi:hypothetical protein [Mesorhizobium sp. RIZ17]